ncbi:hypothetical protein PV396_41950 [Streptomyces sp. ME02-8801-2C]|uniref:hypothetical protein n=1 Tax=Streptomyces sp. ME02-8801-2C TaxID=3028680 RepID=UPI0029B57B32|nr:hypothetical protein [Streptomyces sp. ME02-8801-2C]MDX3458429.1 hypothetical protein [Streptomyces sp. ME02-8801-2C]
MSQDPIRAMHDRSVEKKRAQQDPAYLQALMNGQAPSVIAFVAALDAGHEGDEALDAARRIDQAAANFFNQPPADDTTATTEQPPADLPPAA